MINKKILATIIATILTTAVLGTVQLAAAAENEKKERPGPKEIWAAIDALQNQLNHIILTPGPQGLTGPQGPTGAQGPQGLTGPQGPAGVGGVVAPPHAVDMFIQIDSIPGESTDDKHPGEIEVLSYSFGDSQTGSASTAGGGGAGKASFDDLTFTHKVDKASPKLFVATANGEHIAKAKLTVRKAGGDPKQPDYLTITLENVIISSVKQSGSGDIPTEQVSINFAKIQIEYKPQNPDGSLDAPVIGGWDLKSNTKI